MTDHVLQFCERLDDLTSQEALWLQRTMTFLTLMSGSPDDTVSSAAGDLEFVHKFFEACDSCVNFDFDIVREGNGARYARFFAEENGNAHQVAVLVQQFLRVFRPQECWAITYAEGCTRMHSGQFSGGGLFVTANKIEHVHASDWCASMIEKHKAAQRKSA